jgi:hypothetical protein
MTKRKPSETAILLQFVINSNIDEAAKQDKLSEAILAKHKIPYETLLKGSYLIVSDTESPDNLIDFWPHTGRWVSRDGRRGSGIRSLLTALDKTVSLS